jgi:alkanesulfonate monooxygenase SsuD/methylene tetrahydromethanopterin reductase-like flavin-dependent oxidoreductase (luciferase family)
VPDHVFGATARDGWEPRYDEKDPFHETFATLAFLATATRKIKLSAGVLILPQRQTGLVAKQAAQIDLLSEGRRRLGVGVGWTMSNIRL